MPCSNRGPEATSDGDWLPALWAGDRADRVGVEVHASVGTGGVVAEGPGWRLDPGRYRLVVAVDTPGPDHTEHGASPAASVQVLLDGSPAAERTIPLDRLTGHGPEAPTVTLEFEVEARKVPAPLLELTPVTDLVITSGGLVPLRIRSAVVTRIGTP
jgi:hypothetical protein